MKSISKQDKPAKIVIKDFDSFQTFDNEKARTWHIHIKGRVQGVGFRPFVYQQAVLQSIVGEVSNGTNGVHIYITCSYRLAYSFLNAVLTRLPALAIVEEASMEAVSEKLFSHFKVVEAQEQAVPDLWITPDMAICDACKGELFNPADRRYHYPFITCTQCGPRYSVMQALPFERHFTTMKSFVLCRDCQQEFDDPTDRRFYAQTMSCDTCGIRMEWVNEKQEIIARETEEILLKACEALRSGKTIAVKGIGGFLLLTDAANETAVEQLRKRKHRPTKPFAVMYPSLERLIRDTHISKIEQQLLTGTEAPIVLVSIGAGMQKALAIQALAPGLDKLGVMLPYAPLLLLLANAFAKPLVATSGNLSGSPICFSNQDALRDLAGVADYFLLHNRKITAPQDDSVVAISNQAPIFLRRSRGYAPAFNAYRTENTQRVLATGALMKSSFAMAHQQRVYISQYLGNTDGYEAQIAYQHTLQHMQQLLRFEPEALVTDAHPDYFSHQLANKMAAENGVPCYEVQHHKAHFAAALAEAGLLESRQPVLGVIWDGTGMGNDGNSWGGEFFCFEKNKMKRVAQLDYFPNLLGDKMAIEPRLSVLALLGEDGGMATRLAAMFTKPEWNFYQQLLQKPPVLFTSSMGRLFDAVACIITGISKQSYEGEAAMHLETLANKWVRKNGLSLPQSYWEIAFKEQAFSGGLLLRTLVKDLENGMEAAFVAAKFHATLVDSIAFFAAKANAGHICFSGGVFQNALLVNMMIEKYQKSFKLHFHKQLSPNDENISFGQLVFVDRKIE